MNTTPTTAVRACIAAMALAFGAAGASAQVLPTSPSVISGQASFSRTGNVYSITNTPGAIIQWQSFSIGAGATTRFLQQNASSAVLNRIVGQDPSQILGTLQSNGRVFLVNPNGVVFGAGSRIDVNGLVASSLALSNQDFLAGKMNFAGGATAGAVTNAGVIVTPGGGSVYLIAPSVGNSGVIQSPGGEVVLAAGRSVQLVDSASPNVHVVVSAPEDQAVNLGQILSQGGKVGIYGGLVNQGGQVSADSAVVGANGRIIFKASSDLRLEAGSVTSATGSNGGGTIEMKAARQLTMDRDAVVRADASQAGNGGTVKLLSDGLTRVYGSISARGGAVSGNGGFVETSGRRLDMQGRVDTRAPHGRTGALLLDPTNIFIANDQASATAAGMTGADLTTSGFQAENAVGDSLLTVGTLEHVLGTSMVTVSTENAAGTGAGFIRVVDPVTWVGDTSLTLLATAGIQINAPITGSLGGTLALGTTSGNISQTAPIVMPRLVAHADTGAVILTNAGNQVGQLAGFANGAGGFNFTNGASALTIGAFGTEMVFDTGITSLGAGPININTGGLTLDANVTSAAGNIAIAAGGVFENHAAIGTTSGRITLQGGVIQYSLADCTANPALTGCAAVLPTLAACTADPSLPGCSAVLPPVPVDPPEPVLPSIGACTANPSLAGCDSVLPSLASCTASPTLPGCSVVLPTLSSCTASPTLPGCSVVLPTLSSCIANPTLAGCSVVLPTLSSCTASPTQTGCSVVLPTVASCTASPTQPGCSVVLPTLSSCTASPTQAGCSVVLPTLSACTANPAQAGCSVVLPTLPSCVANPALAGCSVVLPTLASCTASPTQPGCTVVLPSLSACTADPALPGCSVVLPTLASCTASPTQPGCTVVLPSLSACTANPALPGCSVVLPTLASCTASPTQPGCTVVLPSLSACTANPALPGCSVVLPTLASCTASPTQAGCSVVLPSLASCTANPTLAGCSAVLPSLGACMATPSRAGCAVVLPTLAACTANPTAAGCSAVLPPVSACVANPTAPGCVVVVPPQGPVQGSINQAINTTVALINTTTTIVRDPGNVSGSQLTAGGSAPAADSKKDTAATNLADKGDNKTAEPAKKTYCN